MITNLNRRNFLTAAASVAAVPTAAASASTPSQSAVKLPAGGRKASQATGSIPGKNMEINGVRYHVGEQGSGDKVVLLLHGMPDSSGVWRDQVPALAAAGYRVIAPDMLGYGETDKPADSARYAGDKIIADLLVLIETLGVSKLDVVGHDWGAFASWELVLNAPDLFRRHVALAVGHPDSMLKAPTRAEVIESWYMYLNALPGSDALYAANDGVFLKTIVIPTHPDIAEVWSRMRDPQAMNGMLNWDRANPMSQLYLAAATGNATPRKCTVPTLGIWSDGDTYLWEQQMTGSAQWMTAPWRYARITGASHWFMLDKPARTNTLILEWLAQA